MITDQPTEYKEIENLENRTIKAIFKGRRERVLRIYEKVEQMFITGGESTRSIIVMVYILPLTQHLELNFSWGKPYLDLLPKQLRVEYCRQINQSGL